MNHATEFVPVECLCIPKALFFDKRYEDLSVDAKILYSLLLDRKEMAVRNGWIDRYGAVYVLYSREEMEKHLNVPSIRVERALAQLEAHDQMVAVARPYKGRADQIYVRDITADQIIEQEEENMGKKNTKRKNKKQLKGMYCPCMGDKQGMQGVVMTVATENIREALKEIFGGTVVDDETGNEEEEFFIDTEEEKSAEGNEAVCDQTERPDRRYVTDYKNQGYYSLSKKDQRMVDMYVRNYIDMNDQMVDEYVLMDSSRLGKDLILALGCVADDPLSVSEKLFHYLEDLYMQDKLRQVRAAIHALGIILLSEDSYLEDIYKKGEVLADYDGKDFQYEEKYLSGAEFEVYAAENIFTADYQKDAEGNRILEYAEGTLVTTVTTDGSGLAVVKNLPLGKYLVKEANAPTGFVLNSVPQETSMEYADQNTAVIKESVTFDDARQKVEINVEKQDAENGATVAGAGFGIYNVEDLVNDEGKIIVKADTLLQEMTSNENGNVTFTLDLPLGKYYVKELKAPAGFVSSDEILHFDASYQGQNTTVVSLKEIKKNQPTTVEITKSDITTGTELDGANMKVLDKEGNVIDEWTSVKDQPHVIKRLVVGEEYTLREEIAPYGYLKATDVKFRLEDTAEIQKVEMKDEVPTGLLIINKKGEFLDKVTLLDSTKGTVEHLFEYISGNLTEVTFGVYAAENIKAADGVSADYYKADDLVGTITTDDKGIAQLENLPAGKYYVKETATAHGYVLDGEARYVNLSYRDQDTPVITFDEDWQNARQKVIVQVLKKEKDMDRVLAGGVFGLYAAEDIKSASGKVLLKADEIIEQKTTNENGQISFLADLPVDGKYYVKELKAPDGFVTTEEKQEFNFEYKGENVTEVPYELTFENKPTTVELTKSDLTTGEELPGAHLKVTDKDGNIVDEWISEKNPHVIKELTVGKKYTLTETKPADGFVTAESIEFIVENTAEIQKHEMKDDITKVQISKTDITGDKEIPGAKLTILDKNDQVVESWTSTDKPHYVEKLPVGHYTLREEQAPKGFVLTSDVTFEVRDTGEVQTVTMKNDTAKGKIIINKTDADTEKPLKGVEYEIQNSKGKVLEKLVTDAAGHAESSWYEIASYKNGKFNKAIKYYLVETKALDGYELDQTKYEIVFEYADQYTPVIEVKKALTNKETQPGESDEAQPHDSGSTERTSPKTGDTTNLMLPVILLFAAAGTMAGILIRRKRKLNTEKKNND